MPKQKITKEMVVDAAFQLAREGGMERVLVKEIAARLGTTPKAVEHRLDRGRRRLREKLMERGVDL